MEGTVLVSPCFRNSPLLQNLLLNFGHSSSTRIQLLKTLHSSYMREIGRDILLHFSKSVCAFAWVYFPRCQGSPIIIDIFQTHTDEGFGVVWGCCPFAAPVSDRNSTCLSSMSTMLYFPQMPCSGALWDNDVVDDSSSSKNNNRECYFTPVQILYLFAHKSILLPFIL